MVPEERSLSRCLTPLRSLDICFSSLWKKFPTYEICVQMGFFVFAARDTFLLNFYVSRGNLKF